MPDVTAGFETLMEQASYAARGWLVQAIRDIDEHLGDGFAAKNPGLIQGMLIAAALDQHGAMTKLAGQDVRNGIRELCQAIEDNRIHVPELDHIADALVSVAESVKELRE